MKQIRKNQEKSADLACEFYGMISEPGAKTLAWPRGRRGGSAGEGGGGGRVHAFLLGGPGRSGQSSGHKVLCLKIKNDQKNEIRKNIWSKEIKKNEHLGKKELAATPYHRINSFFIILWAQSSMPKNRK